MMGTSIVGGFAAAQFSRKIPGGYVRYFVIVIGFSLAGYYTFACDGVAPIAQLSTGR